MDPYGVHCPLILAPMAGVSDLPFRQLCLQLGADLVVTEMVKSHTAGQLGHTGKRGKTSPDSGLRIVQIVGNGPEQMATAARFCAADGADIIDINMGCPAKKFARKPAGSALMADPRTVEDILQAVIDAVSVPVTLKIRTGVDEQRINAVEIGQIAQAAGVQAITLHGRTRSQRFTGTAEHHTTAQLVRSLTIPVIANGDIDSPQVAARVLEETGASGLMLGRGARRNPWLFAQIHHFLDCGDTLPPMGKEQLRDLARQHLHRIYDHDAKRAPAMAARQLGWLFSGYSGVAQLRQRLESCDSASAQWQLVDRFLNR